MKRRRNTQSLGLLEATPDMAASLFPLSPSASRRLPAYGLAVTISLCEPPHPGVLGCNHEGQRQGREEAATVFRY